MVEIKKLIDSVLQESFTNDKVKKLGTDIVKFLKEDQEVSKFYILLNEAYNGVTKHPDAFLNQLKKEISNVKVNKQYKDKLIKEGIKIQLSELDKHINNFFFLEENVKNIDAIEDAKSFLIAHLNENTKRGTLEEKLVSLSEKYESLNENQKRLIQAIIKDEKNIIKEEISNTLKTLDDFINEEKDDVTLHNKVLSIKNKLLESFLFEDDEYNFIKILNGINEELNEQR